MRPRTKSVVNVSEYFRHESAYAGAAADDHVDDDDWMEIAMNGKSAPTPLESSPHSSHQHYPLHQLIHSYPLTKGRKRVGSESSMTSRETSPSWDESDPDLFDDDDDLGIERLRTCSHGRRISFDDDVSVVTIPSRDSFDDEYKRRVWYSMEDLSRMRSSS
ncbi:hypothetical protein PINS_up003373 [Pythium insidiosum]|nr:hypothetical protein PINS_up003373 [Pythium insidiosum]